MLTSQGCLKPALFGEKRSCSAFSLCLHVTRGFRKQSVATGQSQSTVCSSRELLEKPKRASPRTDTDFLCTPCGLPLPKRIHLELDESRLRVDGRVIIVGDIHGCCDEFLTLLKKCKYREDRDNLILVGDLVNKGPKSCEVLSEAVRLGAWAVRGNHDDGALMARTAFARNQEIDGRFQWVKNLQPEHLEYLNSLPFTIFLPSHHVLVVHAGLLPGVKLDRQKLDHMYTMRDVVLHRKTKTFEARQIPCKNSTRWASKWTGPEHAIFGHDAIRKIQKFPLATGIDSGCVYGNKLTACILPSPASMQDSLKGPVTRKKLRMKMVSVKAKEVYERPKPFANDGA
ncbi:hypothetical protein BSKO_13118 [Bryopsis sp. KO-2023]|nr:hypothetical protein BSKO_13118 [Bryopsis sp. KO-2023]